MAIIIIMMNISSPHWPQAHLGSVKRKLMLNQNSRLVCKKAMKTNEYLVNRTNRPMSDLNKQTKKNI